MSTYDDSVDYDTNDDYLFSDAFADDTEDVDIPDDIVGHPSLRLSKHLPPDHPDRIEAERRYEAWRAENARFAEANRPDGLVLSETSTLTSSERHEKLLAEAAADARRFAATGSDPKHGEPAPAALQLSDRLTEPASRGRGTPKPAVYSIDEDGSRALVTLGNDTAAVMEYLAERVGDNDELAELIAPTPSGRLSEQERDRRDRLATLVAEARERGATLEAIGLGVGRPVSSMHTLVERGRALTGTAA